MRMLAGNHVMSWECCVLVVLVVWLVGVGRMVDALAGKTDEGRRRLR